jgi:NADH-quinone oxidoreductase subunit G
MKEIAHDDVLGFVSRGSHTTLTAHPGRLLDSNYSLNTVDICPVGALTSTDFRFKMRVWFLKETKSICTSCATGCNTIIGSRQDVVYRQTPRENDEVNSCWMCDAGRLNFHYLNAENRLRAPQVRQGSGLAEASWTDALAKAGDSLKGFKGEEIAVIASARMTNEELWMAKRLIDALGTSEFDVVPRIGEADKLLVSADRNPNTRGAQLIGITGSAPGARLPEIADKIRSGAIKAVLTFGEDLGQAGLSASDISKLAALIAVDILPNETTQQATVVLPGSGFAEKRGSMINGKGRLQRLNRAIRSPGQARDDWEIIRGIIQAIGSESNEVYLIEDVFKQIAQAIPEMNGLSLSKIGDQGVSLAGKEAAV